MKKAPTRREILEFLRTAITEEIESDLRHEPGCPCECGIPAEHDPKVIATLSRELRAVVAELDGLPVDEGGSISASLRARIANAWGAAG